MSAHPGFNWVAFITQFAIGASYNISYAPYVSDYSRYLPRHTSRAAVAGSLNNTMPTTAVPTAPTPVQTA